MDKNDSEENAIKNSPSINLENNQIQEQNEIKEEEQREEEKKEEAQKEEPKEDLKKSFRQKVKELFKSSRAEKEKEEKKQEKEKTKENPLSQDEDRTIEEIIYSKGYNCESHSVKTEDGYTLTIYRIPGGKKCTVPSLLPPVLFQHGIFDSSDGWVCNGEEHSLPFIFANNNFDVWISNSRGNKYCKLHDKFDNKSYEFWQFSFHEMGLYDIPAVIEYIKKVNNSGEKIIYFGHSQGCSLMFSGLAQKFEYYKNNLKLFVALAPVARLSNMGSALLNFLSGISIHKLVKKIKIYEMGPNTKGTSKIINFMENYANSLTNFFIGLISDSKSKDCNDQNALAVYLKHSPCGCSLKCLIHFVQIMKSKKFIYYDYKSEANFALYHQVEPPEYDLSVIKNFPIMLIGGEMDKLATPEDVKWLYEELEKNGNVVFYKVYPKMGHLSFMVAKDFSWFEEAFRIIMDEYCAKK